MTTAHSRLHPDLQLALWKMEWRELRAIQKDAIEAWFTSKDHLLISANTAGGKTEAAFLPALSSVAADRGQGSVRILYVGPLKALINDQCRRIEELCSHAEIPVHRWHGDVNQSAKKNLLKHPSGVLLITPESLEAMLMLRGLEIPTVFPNLETVIVDELHAFLENERGHQLATLLNRLDWARQGKARRIGLSATIGDTNVALVEK